MVSAGVPLHESLHYLAESSEEPKDRVICKGLAQQLSSGVRFSKALEKFPSAFDSYQLGLIAVAEKTGALSQVLRIIAEHLERSQELSRRLKSALVYPMILVSGALALLVVAPAWLLEGHFTMLRESGQALPFLTRALIRWSDLCRSPWILALGIAVIGIMLQLRRSQGLQAKIRNEIHPVPTLGRIPQLISTARFARSFSLALKAGLTALQAIPLCVRSTGDTLLIARGDQISSALKSGDTLPDSLDAAGFFPPGFIQVLVAGDESGKITSVLDLMAKLYEFEIKNATQQLTALLEPLLLLLIGVFVGLVLVATMQPTISLLQNL